MTKSPEIFTPEAIVHTPEQRAMRFAQAISHLVTSRIASYETILPDDPNYTVVLDDPTGHFPLQHISPLDLGLDTRSKTHEIYAKNALEQAPVEQTVSGLHIVQSIIRNGLRSFNNTIHHPRSRYTFRHASVDETLKVIRPIDHPKYVKIRPITPLRGSHN